MSNLTSAEIAALRIEHVRIKPELKWDAVCLNHHPPILCEPLIRVAETRERDDFRKLWLQRRIDNFKGATLTLTKWGALIGLGIIVWLYWPI